MERPATKYTKEILQRFLPQSYSFNQLARLIGIAPVGSNTTNLKRRCVMYNLDMSHMTGQSHRRGHQDLKKKHWTEVLVLGDPLDRRREAYKLRRSMIESGIEYKCAECGCDPIWKEKNLKLHIDHIDGRHYNNSKENLRFLCPNCHSQTETWGNKRASGETADTLP